MSQLISTSITVDNLKKIVSVMEAKAANGDANGGKYFNITIAVNDDAPRYGQNVSMWAAQTKEQQAAKANKFYIGNGRTFWSGNGEFVPPKYDPNAAETSADNMPVASGTAVDDLPF